MQSQYGVSRPEGEFEATWELVSFTVTSPSGDITYPMGPDAVGLMIYEASGQMSAHLSKAGLPKFASDDTQAATADETVVAWKAYVGYWGTYTVDPHNHQVEHQVVGSWFPNWVETTQVRTYRFEEDKLHLEGNLALGHATLVWKRLPCRKTLKPDA
jgi:hypothetical protein